MAALGYTARMQSVAIIVVLLWLGFIIYLATTKQKMPVLFAEVHPGCERLGRPLGSDDIDS